MCRHQTRRKRLAPRITCLTGCALIGLLASSAAFVRHPVVHAVIMLAAITVLAVLLCRLVRENDRLIRLSRQLEDREALFKAIFDQAPIGIAVGDHLRLISNINPMFEKTLGRSARDLLQMSWVDYTHPDDVQADLACFDRFAAGETDGYRLKKRFLRPDGQIVWCHMIIARLRHAGETDRYHLCLLEDITDRVQAEESLHESERSKAVLLSHLPGMAYRCLADDRLSLVFVSEGSSALTGYAPDELVRDGGQSLSELIVPAQRQAVQTARHAALAAHVPYRLEYELAGQDQELRWVLELGQGVVGSNGSPETLEGIMIDITETRQREAEIRFLNEHDYLTGLHNHRTCEHRKQALIAQQDLPVSVILGDIDGIRLVNDAFGHAEGDRMIVETARIFVRHQAEGDELARIGGDEFCLLMPGTDEADAYERLKAIQKSCEQVNNERHSRISISLSLGCGTWSDPEESLDQAFKVAEAYMLKRKLLGQRSYHSSVLSSIMATLYARSQETEEHAVRLARLSRRVGMRMGLAPKDLDDLELVAMIHDIGKVGIDDRILNKPGKLTAGEWIEMRKHPEIGYRIAMASSEFEPVASYILTHHERWDGSGYPQGLTGEEIPLLARILAVADAYDAMTEHRVYRSALTLEEAIAELRANSGSQFDPLVVQMFLEEFGLSASA
jgi:diguanylate cyclase (GGDEF)-like protein/PAS domain S-box-containing protein